MVEIKYRAWEKTLKEMIPVRNIDFENKMINIYSAWRLFTEIELMQYTGLKDRYGKEIYEGDIVRHMVDFGPGGVHERISVIKMTPFGINLQHWIFKEDGYLPEIIGNIHEHPYLKEAL